MTESHTCEWLEGCRRTATTTARLPVGREVPACERCRDMAEQIAAKVARDLAAAPPITGAQVARVRRILSGTLPPATPEKENDR